MDKRIDKIIGGIFALSTILLIYFFLTNSAFFHWAFERHHNVLSWYIRPLFIIPIIYFAYKKSWAGIFISIFALFSSMFWFPVPKEINPQVMEFLEYEMEYIKGDWNIQKILFTLLVPIFFVLLILSAWRKNLKILLGTVIGAAILKILWSVIFSGDAGNSIIIPATLGLVICVLTILGYKRYKRKNLDS